MIGADPTVANNSGISARDEARADAIDIYFIYDYDGINGLTEKYPQYSKIALKKKFMSIYFVYLSCYPFFHVTFSSSSHLKRKSRIKGNRKFQ
jgi:hypothetical protein